MSKELISQRRERLSSSLREKLPQWHFTPSISKERGKISFLSPSGKVQILLGASSTQIMKRSSVNDPWVVEAKPSADEIAKVVSRMALRMEWEVEDKEELEAEKRVASDDPELDTDDAGDISEATPDGIAQELLRILGAYWLHLPARPHIPTKVRSISGDTEIILSTKEAPYIWHITGGVIAKFEHDTSVAKIAEAALRWEAYDPCEDDDEEEDSPEDTAQQKEVHRMICHLQNMVSALEEDLDSLPVWTLTKKEYKKLEAFASDLNATGLVTKDEEPEHLPDIRIVWALAEVAEHRLSTCVVVMKKDSKKNRQWLERRGKGYIVEQDDGTIVGKRYPTVPDTDDDL